MNWGRPSELSLPDGSIGDKIAAMRYAECVSAMLGDVARELYETAVAGSDPGASDGEIRELASVIFPGIRPLRDALEESTGHLGSTWYNASYWVHRETRLFAQSLDEELLEALRHFLKVNQGRLLPSLARVYANDLVSFERAVRSFLRVVLEQSADEDARGTEMTAFVASQPGLRENLERMRAEYESGRRTRFAESGLKE